MRASSSTPKEKASRAWACFSGSVLNPPSYRKKCFFFFWLSHGANGKSYNVKKETASPSPQEAQRCSLLLSEHWWETGTTHKDLKLQHSPVHFITTHAYGIILEGSHDVAIMVLSQRRDHGDVGSFGHVLPLVLLRKICKLFPCRQASSVHHH